MEKTVGDDRKARRRPRQPSSNRRLVDDDVDEDVDDWDDDGVDDDARARQRRKAERELAEWGSSLEKQAKLQHAFDLIGLGVDPNSAKVTKLLCEGSTTVFKDTGYRVFNHCTPAGERDWLLFVLFLSKEQNWWPEHAAAHVEYLSQKQFMDPDEWFGEEGRRFRNPSALTAAWADEPSATFKQAWATFKEANSGRSQAEIIAETDAIYKERGPAWCAPSAPKRRRKRVG